MSENSQKPRARVTPLQWLIAGVLAMIFVIVLVVQFGSAGDSSPPIDSTTQPNDVAQQPTAASRPVNTQGKKSGPKPPPLDRPWPAFSLATVLEFDPFARPSSLAVDQGGIQQGRNTGDVSSQKPEDAEKKRMEDAEKKRLALAEVQKEAVQAIVGTDRGFVAIVGTKTIRVGDKLHGFVVKEIKADGVILEDRHD
jgi:hypothetical protein